MPGYRIQSISKTGWKGLIRPWASGELAAFKHMGITASAGKAVFSQEKCCPSKTPREMLRPIRGAAFPGAQESINRDMLTTLEPSKA